MALRGEVRAAALMEACGASGRASWGPRSSARGEGEREEAKTNLATATATTGLSGGGGRRRTTRGHRRRDGDSEATAFAACRAEQRRGCVSRTGAARGEGFWQTRGHARPVWVGGATRGRRRRRAAVNGVTAGNREGRWSEGNSVINSKFKIPVCKLNFSTYSKGQMKNF